MRLREPLWRAQTARTLSQPRLSHVSPPTHAQAGCCADALAPFSPPPPPPAPAKPPAPPKPLAPIAARPTNAGAVGAHGPLGGDDRPGPVGQRGGGARIPPPTPPTPTGGAVDETSSAFSQRSFTHVHGRSLSHCTPNNCGYCDECPTCDGSCDTCCPLMPQPPPQSPPSPPPQPPRPPQPPAAAAATFSAAVSAAAHRFDVYLTCYAYI